MYMVRKCYARRGSLEIQRNVNQLNFRRPHASNALRIEAHTTALWSRCAGRARDFPLPETRAAPAALAQPIRAEHSRAPSEACRLGVPKAVFFDWRKSLPAICAASPVT